MTERALFHNCICCRTMREAFRGAIFGKQKPTRECPINGNGQRLSPGRVRKEMPDGWECTEREAIK